MAAGCRSAPAEVQESMGRFPFAVTFPKTGTYGVDDGTSTRDLHTLATQIHFDPRDMTKAVDQGKTLMDAFALLVQSDPTLDGAVDNVNFPMIYTFGGLIWNGVETVGFEMEVPIKIRRAIT